MKPLHWVSEEIHGANGFPKFSKFNIQKGQHFFKSGIRFQKIDFIIHLVAYFSLNINILILENYFNHKSHSLTSEVSPSCIQIT